VASDRIVVADSGPLIALARIGRLDLLPRLVHRVVIPPAVAAEIRDGGDRPGTREVAAATWIHVEQPDAELARSYGLLVDAGEAEAIALAVQSADSLILLDDRLARRLAESLGIARIGTVGVLVEMRRREWFPSLRRELESLVAQGIHLRQEVMDAALKSVRE